jgi:sodium pump decarboxylase gamma subunit
MILLAATTDKVVTTIPEALLNTAIGMGTVFIVLILISFIIYLLKFVPGLLNSFKKEDDTPAPAVPKAPPVPRPAPGSAVPAKDTQLVAVITAAIEAAMEEEGTPVPPDGLIIRSIKKRY